MPEPVERSSVSSWWRVAHNASSFPPPLWGSGHGIAEVSQDPETQGVAAKGYALFGVGSALGAATERDPHRIGLGRCQRTKRAEVRWRAAGRRLHFDSPKAKPGPAAAPRLARGGPGLGRAPGQIYIQQLSELLYSLSSCTVTPGLPEPDPVAETAARSRRDVDDFVAEALEGRPCRGKSLLRERPSATSALPAKSPGRRASSRSSRAGELYR